VHKERKEDGKETTTSATTRTTSTPTKTEEEEAAKSETCGRLVTIVNVVLEEVGGNMSVTKKK